jgi:hypothetical protein
MKRNCDYCGKDYIADKRNLKRGWGLTCSKSCAAHKREGSKPNYNQSRVIMNNIKKDSMKAQIKTKKVSLKDIHLHCIEEYLGLDKCGGVDSFNDDVY